MRITIVYKPEISTDLQNVSILIFKIFLSFAQKKHEGREKEADHFVA